MGFRYRKSINVGLGFRVNISKSGIGYSWGVPGVRLTKTATGRNRTTLSIPGTGISYVEESGGKKRHSSQSRPSREQHYSDDSIHIRSVENADTSNFAPAHYEEFLQAAQGFMSFNIALRWVAKGLLAFAALSYLMDYIGFMGEDGAALSIACLSLSVLIMIWKGCFECKNRIKSVYEMDSFGKEQVSLIESLVKNLQSNQIIWQVNDFYRNHDSKNHAGTKESVSRTAVNITKKCPKFLKTNVQCYCMKLKKESLYILPDKMLIIDSYGFGVGAIDWRDLDINVGSTLFTDDSVPNDALVVDEVWQYMNKDGSRDKRYKNNHKLAVCGYGTIEFNTEQGFNTLLYVSNVNKAKEFEKLLTAGRRWYSRLK